MKTAKLILAGVALAAVSGVAAARDNVSFSVSFGMPAPVFVSPAPVFVPAPTYYPPPPAYYPPAPAYYAPATVYYSPVRVPVYAPYVVRPVYAGHRGHGRGNGHWR